MFVHSSVDGYTGSFHLLDIVSNPAMNIPVPAFVWTHVFSSLGYTPRSGISGLWGNSNVYPSEEAPDCFPKWLHHFMFPQAEYEDSVFSIFCLHLLLYDYLIVAIPLSTRGVSL